ncbi:NAD(P)H-dependent flavin oxidoreductase [Marinobacterium sediminicola]|uniref:Nitronate monooxygenase n=1 Tax=Marinobacterium sediminicola TaxID=518898 RepID=A0ABY1S0D0_9GAMM|nr:nitronate monooxygenase [Marinobacterium sediminicola]ULG70074.1 nitronate monooxygenase [Marinobacterium sediminicola]SMR74530.1 nitronate monooxygenase [Marinobacterium sediminicola]
MNIFQRTRLPLLVAPMFLVSSPALVIAGARAGVIGALPAANARTVETLDEWLAQIHAELHEEQLPWLLNMIVHSSYDRFDAELELVRRYQPAIVTTALGSPARVTDTVKAYGGQVFADVITPAMAKKSIAAGVDGLILVCSGAGGHTGRYNPLAFINEVREFWDGPLGVAGCVSRGRDVLAMQAAGADFVVVGTRFIAAQESFASDEYRDMLVASGLEDIVETTAVSGVNATWMKASLEKAGIQPEQAASSKPIDFSGNISTANKAWKDVWSAGQGVGATREVASASQIIDELHEEYVSALKHMKNLSEGYL